MAAKVIEQYWENGRLHRWLYDDADGKTTHERLTPPAHIAAHRQRLEDLKHDAKGRAQRADGLVLAASITTNERDDMHRAGIKLGDADALKWALKQDRWSHAKVLKT